MLLLDGYNAIFSDDVMKKLATLQLGSAREALNALVVAYARATGHRCGPWPWPPSRKIARLARTSNCMLPPMVYVAGHAMQLCMLCFGMQAHFRMHHVQCIMQLYVQGRRRAHRSVRATVPLRRLRLQPSHRRRPHARRPCNKANHASCSCMPH